MAESKPAKVKSKSKSQIYADLAEATELTRQQVVKVFESLTAMIKKELGKKGPGVMTIPGLMKLQRVQKKATKGGTRPSPFDKTKMITVKPKPASLSVRVRPLKDLREMIK